MSFALSLFLFTGGADVALSLLLVVLLATLTAFDLVELVITPGVTVVMAHALTFSFSFTSSMYACAISCQFTR